MGETLRRRQEELREREAAMARAVALLDGVRVEAGEVGGEEEGELNKEQATMPGLEDDDEEDSEEEQDSEDEDETEQAAAVTELPPPAAEDDWEEEGEEPPALVEAEPQVSRYASSGGSGAAIEGGLTESEAAIIATMPQELRESEICFLSSKSPGTRELWRSLTPTMRRRAAASRKHSSMKRRAQEEQQHKERAREEELVSGTEQQMGQGQARLSPDQEAAVQGLPENLWGEETALLMRMSREERDSHLDMFNPRMRAFMAESRIQAREDQARTDSGGSKLGSLSDRAEVAEGLVPGGLQSQDGAVPDLPPDHTPTHQDPEGLPTWEEAHTTQIFTMRHVPKAAREDWARVLGATVNDLCADPTSNKKWLLLYILARCVLPARPITPEHSASKEVK